MADLSTTLGTDAGAEATPSAGFAIEGNKLVQTGFWAKTKEKIGSVQSAITSPVQSFGRSAATKLGASDTTAATVGAALLPVVVVAVLVVVVVAVVRRGGFFSKSVTL
jgi:hypothetical protein